MKHWTETTARALTWKISLPSSLGLGLISIHVPTMLALLLSGLALGTVLSGSLPTSSLRAMLITLPVVWLVSLATRITAQYLAVGKQSNQFEMVVSPLGNASSDYENLSGPSILMYSVAGQSASLMLGLFGLLILSGMTPSVNGLSGGLTMAMVLDFQVGWHPQAWASQTVWVNGFLFLLHLLPAGPLDARAFVVGWCHVSRPTLSDAAVHRLLASTNSHLATALAAFSLAMIGTRLPTMESMGVWIVMLVVSGYLILISNFESYQAESEEEAAALLPRRQWKSPNNATAMRPGGSSHTQTDFDAIMGFNDSMDIPSPHEVLDVDEILRKLYREGQESLSAFEKEALLSASRELQARRHPRR